MYKARVVTAEQCEWLRLMTPSVFINNACHFETLTFYRTLLVVEARHPCGTEQEHAGQLDKLFDTTESLLVNLKACLGKKRFSYCFLAYLGKASQIKRANVSTNCQLSVNNIIIDLYHKHKIYSLSWHTYSKQSLKCFPFL